MKKKTPQNPLVASLFERLAARNIGEDYVRRVALPEWWNDEIADSQLGFAQMSGFIASKLGLDIASLFSGPIGFAPRRTAWKKPVNARVESLEVEGAIASQAARIAIEATPGAASELPQTATSWRARLLQKNAQVTFESLLQLCWECGIAVLTLTGDALPTRKDSRPHGLAAHFDNRFAVVLMGRSNDKHTAWQLFRLAHEVGHIARGHLREDGVIFDEKIWGNAEDAQETEANRFAVELLFGRELEIGGDWLNADELVRNATRAQQQFCVEPGALILNWAKHQAARNCGQNCWATANRALAQFASPDAHDLVRAYLQLRLRWDELGDEQAAFLRRINGFESRTPLPKVELAA